MTRHLLVPGRGVPRPEHWLRRWAAANPGYRWAPEPPGPPLILRQRVAALHEVVTESEDPAVLIAHSGGCISTVVWAAHHTGPVRAALLVAPPDLDSTKPRDPSDMAWVVPEKRLPFRAIVVASRTDPYCSFERSQHYARAWGAELVDAGDAGHLDTASGYGPWPRGEELVRELG